MEQKRTNSPVLWSSLAALVLGVLIAAGVITPTQNDAINKLIPYLLDVLVAFGIVNNPTKKDGL